MKTELITQKAFKTHTNYSLKKVFILVNVVSIISFINRALAQYHCILFKSINSIMSYFYGIPLLFVEFYDFIHATSKG